MSEIHNFDIDLACKYGIEESVLINNLYFWIRHNAANDTNYYNDRYWTYNTTKALAELFPYMSERKIARILEKLTKEGIIVKGNYNKNQFDRTCWYAFTDKGIGLFQNGRIHLTKMTNAFDINDKPIPDINKDNITYNKEIEDKSSTKKEGEIFEDEYVLSNENVYVDINKNITFNDYSFKIHKEAIALFIDKIYNLYPSRCPKRNKSTGKTIKDKERIRNLLRIYSMNQIEKVMNAEIKDKYNKEYISNFSTFLNNFPDPDMINDEVNNNKQGHESIKEEKDKLFIKGQLYK